MQPKSGEKNNQKHIKFSDTFSIKIKIKRLLISSHKPTPKNKSCWATGKFGFCFNRLKTVLLTDQSVPLIDKSVVTTDFLRCLNNDEFFETTDQIC
jgi:hypothetical protein